MCVCDQERERQLREKAEREKRAKEEAERLRLEREKREREEAERLRKIQEAEVKKWSSISLLNVLHVYSIVEAHCCMQFCPLGFSLLITQSCHRSTAEFVCAIQFS